jgi:DNA repair protein RadD
MEIQVGPYVLRKHQTGIIGGCREAAFDGVRRIMVQGPCGFGKTIVALGLISRVLSKQGRVLVLADTRQLVYQLSDKLDECQISHSVLMAGEEYKHSTVTIASKQTMYSRCYKKESIPKPVADVVIVDEAHKSLSGEWQRILKDYSGSFVIGLSATPEGTGAYYDRLLVGGTYEELTPEYLTPCRVFAPYTVDMKGVPVRKGEYVSTHAQKQFNTDPLVGDIFDNWSRIAPDRRTVLFASGVEHSIHLCEVFNARGVAAAHVDASTPQRSTPSKRGREDIFDDLRHGRIQVVCNVRVCDVGWDEPSVSCGVLAFSTLSVVRYMQTCGRLFRTFEGKEDAILIDHGGNVARHGWPTSDIEYDLNPKKKLEDRVAEDREASQVTELHCPSCGYVWPKGKSDAVCPCCGAQKVRRGFPKKIVDGDLKEVVRHEAPPKTNEQKQWDRCLGVAANLKGGSARQARLFFYRDTGRWPTRNLRNWLGHDATPEETDEVFHRYRRRRG